VSKKGADLERMVETWLQMNGYLVHRAAAAGHHSFGSFHVSKSNDIFGALDLLAIKREGTWAIQCTTASNRSARRKKVAKHADKWPLNWRVSVLIHDWKRVGAATLHVLLIEDLVGGAWVQQVSYDIDPKAIEAWRKEQSPVTLSEKPATLDQET
jgi:hypothetical protein